MQLLWDLQWHREPEYSYDSAYDERLAGIMISMTRECFLKSIRAAAFQIDHHLT